LRHFKEDLYEDLLPPMAAIIDNSLPYADIEEDTYAAITNSAQVNIWAASAYNHVEAAGENSFRIGLDTENNWSYDSSVDSKSHACSPNLPTKQDHCCAEIFRFRFRSLESWFCLLSISLIPLNGLTVLNYLRLHVRHRNVSIEVEFGPLTRGW
jgi:hypothetical protein